MNEKDLENELNVGIYVKRPILKAIKLKCLDCCGGNWNEVKECVCKDSCFLHPFRLGKNPFAAKRILTDEQREAAKKRFEQYRSKK